MRRASLALLLLVLAAGPSSATELWSRGDARVAFSGSLREFATIGSQTDEDDFLAAVVEDLMAFETRCVRAAEFADCPAFDTIGEQDAWQSLTRLRARLDVDFTSYLRAVVVYDNEVSAGILDTFEGSLGRAVARGDLVDAETTVVDEDRIAWRQVLYRGFVQLETEKVDVSIGRQRIAWGVGRLWNPIDRFNAIPPLAAQAGQSRGIDAIDAKWSFDGFNFVEAVYAPGSNRDRARYALRLHGVALDSDISLMGGVFEKAPTVGLDFARNLRDAAVRLEFVYTHPRQKVWKIDWTQRKRLDDFVQVVVSADYTFDFADGIYVLIEHLYNGNALGFGRGRAGTLLPFFEASDTPPDPDVALIPGPYAVPGSPALFGSSRVVTSAKNQTGFMVGGDLTPELRLDLLTIYDWNGESAAFFPSLKYSPLAALEVTLGVQTFVGPRLSQFGAAKTFVYVLADVFF
ncbi:MAG: hypothetical protein VX466_13500 [Myxococcota bacterium]|nr:hypothetical protein [Myxococcota bacterium]